MVTHIRVNLVSGPLHLNYAVMIAPFRLTFVFRMSDKWVNVNVNANTHTHTRKIATESVEPDATECSVDVPRT